MTTEPTKDTPSNATPVDPDFILPANPSSSVKQEEANASTSGNIAATDDRNDDDASYNWFLEALQTLGHFDPESVAHAYKVDADEELILLTLWLEDRVIRAWDLAKRDRLRSDFWCHIDQYLNEMECPEGYFRHDEQPDTTWSSTLSSPAAVADQYQQPQAPAEQQQLLLQQQQQAPDHVAVQQQAQQQEHHWRYDTTRRVRVIYWLISTAVSEAYGDAKDVVVDGRDDVIGHNNVVEKRTNVNDTDSTFAIFGNNTDVEWNPKDFPLGFSTGDAHVDRILTLLRMQFLVQLQDEQSRLQAVVANCQQQRQNDVMGKTKAKPSSRRRR